MRNKLVHIVCRATFRKRGVSLTMCNMATQRPHIATTIGCWSPEAAIYRVKRKASSVPVAAPVGSVGKNRPAGGGWPTQITATQISPPCAHGDDKVCLITKIKIKCNTIHNILMNIPLTNQAQVLRYISKDI